MLLEFDLTSGSEHAVFIVLVALAFLLPIVAALVNLYQKLRPSGGDRAVTVAALDTYKKTVAQDIENIKKNHESWERRSQRFVTREELLTSRTSLLEPLITAVKEHGTMLHELTEYIHQRDTQMQDQLNQIGLKMETNLSQIWRTVDVLKDRLKRYAAEIDRDKGRESSSDSDERPG